MKKIFLAALAATILFAGCSKETNPDTTSESAQLTIKIAGAATQTRAIEAPGSEAEGTIQLDGGHIFVLTPTGTVTYSEALNTTTAISATGQKLAQKVASDSRVFVLGNLPSDAPAMSSLTSLDAILTTVSAISTQSNYRKAVLANVNSTPVGVTLVDASNATVTVSVNPVISRLELVQVKGGADSEGAITAFTVTGVYVDDYFPSFTFAGGNSGTMFEQHQSTTFSGIGDTGTWAASGNPLVAAPASSSVWAHNVASEGLPRLLIEVTGVKYMPDGATEPEEEVDLGTDKYYLTVTSYTGMTTDTFVRGHIYRIGGADGITFGPKDLGITPNPIDVDLTVMVKIVEWVLVTPNAVL